MSEDKNAPLTDHDYDGIQEYDNPLPTWWLWTFFLTIIFSFIYYIHYESGSGPTLNQELAISLKDLETQSAQHSSAASESVENLEALIQDPKFVSVGAGAFESKCAACHRNDLGGQIGPNLVDTSWLHGKGTATDIAKVVREGVPDKGMPPWGTVLSKEELYGVTAYILSKKGSHPANAKSPQGEVVE